MPNSFHWAQFRSTMTVALVAALLQGCDGGSDKEAAVIEHAADPRFVSADALVEHYNSLTTVEPVNARAALDLFHAENDLQAKYISAVRGMVPIAELDHLMFERFGEFLDPKRNKSMLSPDGPATITVREDRRAQATFRDSDGEQSTLYLVQIDGRWRVSGYTIEYEREWDEAIADPVAFERGMQKTGTAAESIARRLRDGSLTSAAAVRRAFGEAIAATIESQ